MRANVVLSKYKRVKVTSPSPPHPTEKKLSLIEEEKQFQVEEDEMFNEWGIKILFKPMLQFYGQTQLPIKKLILKNNLEITD